MNQGFEAIYSSLCNQVRETKVLETIHALLEWDQQTQLPVAAGSYRADQIACLAGEIHRRQTDPRIGDYLGELLQTDLAADPHSDSGATLRELSHQFERKSKLPVELVERQAAASSLGQNVWVEARRDNDYRKFAPHLQNIMELKRQEAQAIGGSDCLYDALLDEYEPGATAAQVGQVLGNLKAELVPLIAEAADLNPPTITEPLRGEFPKQQQREFVIHVTSTMGFDYDRGRLDTTHHPFCTELGPDDCRLTTRFDETFFSSGFFGTLHEAGHGMYEQGLRADQYGLPPGNYCSLGLHESQSRLWENLVGRSWAFWDHFYPLLQQKFPSALAKTTQREFFLAVNDVRPSLIRVEADEATYNLHIIIRFELEQALLNDQLAVEDLPEAWNSKYQHDLGLTPPTDTLGVLQDIHWAAGLIGYFPTYSLGNIYASQLFQQAHADLGDLEGQFRAGNFAPLLDWLRQNIHSLGQRFRAGELIQRAAQSSIDHGPLIQHLRDKLLANQVE